MGDVGCTGRLAGKVAVVTGAASGMGVTHSRRFVTEGARVVLTDILDESGQTLAEQLGPDATFVHHNVADPEGWDSVIAAAEAAYGPVNVLINNAGVALNGPLEGFALADFRTSFEVNQVSVFLGMKAVIPSMKKAGGGSIVNVSSLAGLVGGPGAIAYSATKFAVRGMTKVAAIELGRYGIRVNSVHPGAVKTRRIMESPIYDSLEKYGTTSPLGRLGEPEELTNLVLFLASDEASYSTGAEFVADAGATAI